MIRSGQLATEADVQRFHAEAEAAANLDHPHIVPVFDAGEAEGFFYMASAYCSGPNLAVWLAARKQSPSPETAARLILALAEAVHHAHQHVFVIADAEKRLFRF